VRRLLHAPKQNGDGPDCCGEHGQNMHRSTPPTVNPDQIAVATCQKL
jgi:hypothetical protein